MTTRRDFITSIPAAGAAFAVTPAFLAEEGVTMAGYPEDDEPGEPPVVSNRNEASANLSAVEEFFRAREPASPIPVLLLRARTYLDKDFSAIVAELIPPPPAD